MALNSRSADLKTGSVHLTLKNTSSSSLVQRRCKQFLLSFHLLVQMLKGLDCPDSYEDKVFPLPAGEHKYSCYYLRRVCFLSSYNA